MQILVEYKCDEKVEFHGVSSRKSPDIYQQRIYGVKDMNIYPHMEHLAVDKQ